MVNDTSLHYFTCVVSLGSAHGSVILLNSKVCYLSSIQVEAVLSFKTMQLSK